MAKAKPTQFGTITGYNDWGVMRTIREAENIASDFDLTPSMFGTVTELPGESPTTEVNIYFKDQRYTL